MVELLSQKDIEKYDLKLDKGQKKVDLENQKMSDFKVKSLSYVEKSFIKEKMKFEKKINSYKIKIELAKNKYDNNLNFEQWQIESNITKLNNLLQVNKNNVISLNSENKIKKIQKKSQDLELRISNLQNLLNEVKQKQKDNQNRLDQLNIEIENKNNLIISLENKKEKNVILKEIKKLNVEKNAIEKVLFKFNKDTELNKAKIEKITKFCESRIEYWNSELDIANQNYELAKKDVIDGVTKAEELNIQYFVSSVKNKYNKMNFKLNVKEFKKTYKENKKNHLGNKEEIKNDKLIFKQQVRDLWETTNKSYTPLFIKRELFNTKIKNGISNYIIDTKAKMASVRNWTFRDWATMKIWGVPFYLLAFFVTVIGLSIGFDVIKVNMIYAFASLIVLSIVFGVIFEKIPVFNRYMGGAVIGCMLIGAIFVSTGIMGEDTTIYKTIKTWFDDQGFLDFYVSVLLIGAVLSIPRKMIIKALGGFFGIILIGTLGSIAFGFLASVILNISLEDLLLNYALPILCAGNGGGVQPIADMAEQNGFDKSVWLSSALAISTIASIISILFAAVLDNIGRAKQTWSGNGQLMKQDVHTIARKEKITHRNITVSILTVCIIFIFSTFIAKKIITKDLVGIEIPNYAWMVFICLFINLGKLLPEDIKQASLTANTWIAKQTTWLLMFGVGVCYIDLNEFIKALSFKNLFVSFMFVLGSAIAIMLVAKMFKMNPIEATLSGGMCMTAQGGTGVVSVLGVSNRMELMAFGQITCRIGGSLILVLAAILFGYYSSNADHATLSSFIF